MSLSTKPNQTVWDHFAEISRRYADNLAVVDGDVRWTYGDLAERSAAYARGLMAQGVEQGEHVALLMKNCPEWVAFRLAVMQIGAVLVAMNTRYKVEELAYGLRQSDSVVLLTMAEFVGIDFHAMLSEIIPHVGAAELPKLRRVVSLGDTPFPGGLTLQAFERSGGDVDAARLEARRRSVTADDIAFIIYTSGTTGAAKGAMHDQGQVLLGSSNVTRRIADDDRLMVLSPFFHIMGFNYGANGPVHAGAATIILATFNAERALQLIEAEGVTAVSGTPTMYQMMMARPEFPKRDLSSLRYVMMGGAPATPAFIEEILRQFPGTRVSSGFGMSETMGVTLHLPEDTPEQIAHTLGVLHAHVEARIVDPKTCRELPEGEPGELWLRGANITRGYYNMPEATEHATSEDGWFRTGDLFVRQPDGHLSLTGRLKELYIRGGSNIYPAEVENFLGRHPDIAQAWVVGVPDEMYGEVGMAFIQTRDGTPLTEDQVKAYCKGKIASYKIPQYVQFTSAFPLTATGKVRKYKLQEEGRRLLGLT